MITTRNARAWWTVPVRLGALRLVRRVLQSNTLPVTALETLVVLKRNGLFKDLTKKLTMDAISKLLTVIGEVIEPTVHVETSRYLLISLLQSLASFSSYDAPCCREHKLTHFH